MDDVALVTGGLGFIGHRLVEDLLKIGYETIVLDNMSSGSPGNIDGDAEILAFDIGDSNVAKKLDGLENRISLVFHCARDRGALRDPVESGKQLLIQLNFLKMCRDMRVKKIVVFSHGDSLYGEPLSLPIFETDKETPQTYEGVNQLAVEANLPLLGIPWIAARYPEIYGPGQKTGIVPRLLEKLADGEPWVIFDRDICARDFIYVDDVVRGAIAAAKSDLCGTFNFSSGQDTNVAAIIKSLVKQAGLKFRFDNVSGKFCYRRSCFSNSKAVNYLSWTPAVPLSKGLRITFDSWTAREDCV